MISQGRTQEQAGEVLAAFFQGDFHAFLRVALAGHDKREESLFPVVIKFGAEPGQGRGQLGHGPLVHAGRAVYAERAVTGSGHARHQPAGGAGFVHIELVWFFVLVLAVRIAAAGTVLHAGNHEHAVPFLDGRAAGLEASPSAGDVV